METENKDNTEDVEVEAYAGYVAGETPRKVIINGRKFPVEYIVFKDRKCDVKTKDISEHFRLKLTDFGECDIVYDTKWDRWKLKKKPEKTFIEIWNEAKKD